MNSSPPAVHQPDTIACPEKELPPSVEELADRAAIGALKEEWESLRHRLAENGGTRGPFLSPSFFAVFAASIVRGPARSLRLLIAHRNGRICGLWPLLFEHRRLAGVPARVLRSLGDEHSQRYDALVVDDETASAFVHHLVGDRAWDAIELRDVLTSEGTTTMDWHKTGIDRIVAAARQHRIPVGTLFPSASPFLSLPTTEEALEVQLSSKFRANLRRRARNLIKTCGPLSLELVTSPRAVRAALDDGLRLEAAGWKGEKGTAIACDVDLDRRYRALARAFAMERKLALYFLKAGERRIAFHFGLVEEGVYFLLKPGYEPSLAVHSPGHLLLHFVARDLIRRGIRELDLLGDPMPWKADWTAELRGKSWVYLFSPSPFGRALGHWRLTGAPRLRATATYISGLVKKDGPSLGPFDLSQGAPPSRADGGPTQSSRRIRTGEPPARSGDRQRRV
jgi:CelD/BcsL family acetyltransferase involved in cellulose biosynthesis